MEKRCATLEAECQNSKSKFELELCNVRQEPIGKKTDDGMILALNDACQQNTDVQREAEQKRQVKAAKLQNHYHIYLFYIIFK